VPRETFAPILFRQSATSTISGSRAALSITVVPLASDAAINAVCVPLTVTFERRTRRHATLFARNDGCPRSGYRRRASSYDQQIDGRVPIAQPPGIETLASPMRKQRHDPEARAHFRDSS
jgi:hypothetical protein